MISKYGVLGLTMAVMMSVSTFSAAYAELIKDSYIVTFKKAAEKESPLIEPPDKANQRMTPFTGVQTLSIGTSFSAPCIAGLFATACQAA